jgi:hypothetical protein
MAEDGPDLASTDRRLADYATAFSFLADLASARSEAQAIERIIGMFTTLCAPSCSAYLQCGESGPGPLVTVPPQPDPEADTERLASLSGRWSRTSSGRGFTLRIADAAGTLGVLEVEDVAVPDRLDHYINLGLGLVDVCALAVRNARTHEQLVGTLAALQLALAEVKTLSGLLPICAWCKRIRDDVGTWDQIEAYVRQHSDATFTHGICPDCAHKMHGAGR